MHRNSQKRIYLKDATYFVTTKTYDNAPYFQTPSFAEYMVEQIFLAKSMKSFSLFAYVIMPDHLHLLFRPSGEDTVSTIIHFIKRHSSRNIRILSRFEGADGHPRLQSEQTFVHRYHADGHPRLREAVFFRWQKSFHDHIIRNERDFINHVNYIHYNPVKHGLVQKPEDYPFSSYRDFHGRGWPSSATAFSARSSNTPN